MTKSGAIHLALEFNQGPVLLRLCAPFGTISAIRLYTHMLIIAGDNPQKPILE